MAKYPFKMHLRGLGLAEKRLRRYYKAWSKDVSPEIRLYFDDLIRAFTNWQRFILNY